MRKEDDGDYAQDDTDFYEAIEHLGKINDSIFHFRREGWTCEPYQTLLNATKRFNSIKKNQNNLDSRNDILYGLKPIVSIM